MSEYPIVISWLDEDDVYLAEIPDLQGCRAHGDTPEEALREVLKVREMWLDVALEDGRPIPEPKVRRLVAV